MRTFEGRAIKAEGNPDHPVNHGKLCSRGLVGVQGLYNPDRIKGPGKRASAAASRGSRPGMERGPGRGQAGLVRHGDKVAFYLGLAPDHLFDLVSELARPSAPPPPCATVRWACSRAAPRLVEAAGQVFGEARFPYL